MHHVRQQSCIVLLPLPKVGSSLSVLVMTISLTNISKVDSAQHVISFRTGEVVRLLSF